MRPCAARDDGRITAPGPALLGIKADANACAADPREKCRPIAVGQIYDGVKPPASNIQDEAALLEDRAAVQRKNLIHMRVASQDIFRASVHQDGEPRRWIGQFERM